SAEHKSRRDATFHRIRRGWTDWRFATRAGTVETAPRGRGRPNLSVERPRRSARPSPTPSDPRACVHAAHRREPLEPVATVRGATFGVRLLEVVAVEV